jgi:hypothetical protein
VRSLGILLAASPVGAGAPCGIGVGHAQVQWGVKGYLGSAAVRHVPFIVRADFSEPAQASPVDTCKIHGPAVCNLAVENERAFFRPERVKCANQYLAVV